MTEFKHRLTNNELALALESFPDRQGLGSYQMRELFTGQERPRQQLVDLITTAPLGTVAFMAEPLGAGKSSLVSMTMAALVENGHATLEECLRTSIYSITRETTFEDIYWTGHFYGMEKPDWSKLKPKVMFVEEFDIKGRIEDFEEKMKTFSRFLGRDMPIIVFSGDNSLKNEHLFKLLNSPYKPVQVQLDPLTPDMLRATFAKRVGVALATDPDTINTDDLFDKKFLDILIPDTNPSVATMRTTLVILQEMKTGLPFNSKPAQFNSDLYAEAQARANISTRRVLSTTGAEAWHFISSLHSHIATKGFLEPLTHRELATLYPYEIGEEEYQDVLKHLKLHGILKSVGIPFKNGNRDRYPEPYLPSQETFLDAHFYPLPPLTPHESEVQKQIEFKREQLSRLKELHDNRLIDDSIFAQEKALLLGLDTLVKEVIDGKIGLDQFTKTKQELEALYEG